MFKYIVKGFEEMMDGKQNIIERDFGKWDGIAENDETRF